MAQNVTIMGASYSEVPAVTLPKTGGGTARFTDASVTTAIESDVATGKLFIKADGSLGVGTSSGGGGGYVTQDQDGYLVLPPDGGGGGSVTVEPLSVTQNGTYTAPTGKAYSPVSVNVSGGGPTPTPPEPWVRPSDWPDLSKMDVSGGDILYMTSYADEARGFCSFYCICTGQYTVEVGTISGSTFTAESTQSYNSSAYCELYYGSANGTYKVLRVTGTNITSLRFRASYAITIDTFCGFTSNQGIIDVVGKLPSCSFLDFNALYNIVNVEISDVVLKGYRPGSFSSCYSLASLDVSSWDTGAVTDTGSMFSACYSLTSLDVSGWDTSKVTYMGSMFSNCTSLTSLDVSDWDTGAVTNMSSMFSSCSALTSLDVSDWDTSAVTNMYNLFSNCYSLTSLDVSSWDTSAATNIGGMFSNCSALTSLDVSDWDTSAVTNMTSMFNGCCSLASLDVSGFETGAVTGMTSMFYNCRSLTSLDVSDWDTGAVTNMSNMFSGCYSLVNLDVSGWDTGAVTNMNSLFYNCASIISLDVSGWDTGAVTNMNSLFSGCYSLVNLDVSDWDTSKVINMTSMFCNCATLTSLDISSWDFSKITTASNTANMFQSCYGIHGSLTLPASMAFIGTSCFSGCRSLTEWHFLATTPPTLASANAFNVMSDFGGKKIYVPAASLSAYQTASNWSTYASYMVGE